MQHDEAKMLIKSILESEVRFEGHFNKCFDNLKDTRQKGLIEWIKECKLQKTSPIQSRNKRDVIGFVNHKNPPSGFLGH